MVRGCVTSIGVVSSNLLNSYTTHVVERVKRSNLANSCLGNQGGWSPTNACRAVISISHCGSCSASLSSEKDNVKLLPSSLLIL